MSHWFDEYTKGVAEGLPWAAVLRRVAHALREGDEIQEELPQLSRRVALAGFAGVAGAWLIEKLTPPAAADAARARKIAAEECANHENKNGLARPPANDYFEG